MGTGAIVTRNATYNLVGQVVPILVAFLAIPYLIHGLGVERFGIVSIAWLVIGYFSLFDLGIGRALTQVVSEKIGCDEGSIPKLLWTGLGLMFVLGITGSFVLVAIAPWIVYTALKIPKDFQAETLSAFYLLALSLPVVISTAGFVGILSAFQRFDVINILRLPMGVYSFLGPLATLPFTHKVDDIVTVLITGRIIAWLAHLIFCLKLIPPLHQAPVWDREATKHMLLLGGWMTVSNVIGPLMVYLDRFLIGGFVSMAAVTYYATPYELITKLSVFPVAIAGVLFPAFAARYKSDQEMAEQLFFNGTKLIYIALFPVTLILITFSHDVLSAWLGSGFANHSSEVLQWLAVGVFINSLALIPSALIQGAGRPDVTAKFHLVEFPIYLGFLWLALKAYGIQGAAAAWALRMTIDAGLLFIASRYFLTVSSGIFMWVLWTIPASLVFFALSIQAGSLLQRVILVSVGVFFSVILG